MTIYKDCEIPVTILGKEWWIKIVQKEKEERFDKLQCDGFCDYSVHELVVRNCSKLESENDWSIKDPKASIQHSIAHEMVHAFMYESGLAQDWEHKEQFGQEETVVDWIAWQAPKMAEALNSIWKELCEKEIEK